VNTLIGLWGLLCRLKKTVLRVFSGNWKAHVLELSCLICYCGILLLLFLWTDIFTCAEKFLCVKQRTSLVLLYRCKRKTSGNILVSVFLPISFLSRMEGFCNTKKASTFFTFGSVSSWEMAAYIVSPPVK
jgi:hypothetical protein